MTVNHERSDAEKAADIIGEIVANSMFSDCAVDPNGEPAGLVDGLFAIAAPIRYHADTVAREIGAIPVGGES